MNGTLDFSASGSVRPMLSERRKSVRRHFNRVAHFYAESATPRTCMVADISRAGARLCSEFEMPNVFTLVIATSEGELRRSCNVVWRLGVEHGVSFMDVGV
jgi:hypothetical protein